MSPKVVLEDDTSVAISRNRLNGLRFKTATLQKEIGKKAEVSVKGVLDEILEKAGIPELSHDALEKKMDEMESAND